MQAIATWKGRREFLLEDGFSHTITVDLPLGEGGRSAGPRAVDLSLFALAASVATEFVTTADRLRFVIYGLSVALETELPRGTAASSPVHGTLRVRTRADLAEVTGALRSATRSSPVAEVFRRAGVDLRITPIVLPVGPSASSAVDRPAPPTE